MASPRKEPLSSPATARQVSVEDALERIHLKTPGRHNSYSDSTDGDEEVEEAFSASAAEHGRNMWERSIYHTPSGNLGLGRYDSTGNLDDTVHSSFYSPNVSMTRMDLSKRCRTNPAKIAIVCMPVVSAQHLNFNLLTSTVDRGPSSPEGTDQEASSNPMLSSPTSPSPDPLPPPLPLPLNLTMSGNGQDMEDFVPV